MVDPGGEKVGSIEEIYLDQETDRPEWALVNTGLFGGRSTFVPLEGATEQDGKVRVNVDQEHAKDAPNVDASGELTHEEEAQLYRHYGMEDSGTDELRERAETRGTEPSAQPGRFSPSRRLRLRRYVVTEVVTDRGVQEIEREEIGEAEVDLEERR